MTVRLRITTEDIVKGSTRCRASSGIPHAPVLLERVAVLSYPMSLLAQLPNLRSGLIIPLTHSGEKACQIFDLLFAHSRLFLSAKNR